MGSDPRPKSGAEKGFGYTKFRNKRVGVDR